jgi:hypothetical protein
MRAYGITVLLGAFLLFLVQPLIAKYLLSWFGGGPAVWTTCMLFFQVFLLGGYAYAHVLARYFRPSVQAALHLTLLLAALACLPIMPSAAWKPQTSQNPVPAILFLLACNVGIPYFVLSATGPLLQNWAGRDCRTTSPYSLYSLSNLGSLLALVCYPLVFEVCFARKTQATLWGWGLAAFSLGCGFCAIRLWNAAKRSAVAPSEKERPASSFQNCSPGLVARALWLLWPACASVLLLAITNKLCLDVAVFPFLWVLPLALYLLSFVICFGSARLYPRFPWTLALVVALGCLCWALFKGAGWPFLAQVCVYAGALFVCCVVCHGELFRLRPGPELLTGFYLMVAAGGALGGLFVSVLAPVIFTQYYELHWGVSILGFLLAAAWTVEVLVPAVMMKGSAPAIPERAGAGGGKWKYQDWRGLGLAFMWLFAFGLAVTLWFQARRPGTEIVHKSRNFYGVLTVFEHRKDEPNGHHFLLQHGRITHGFQFANSQLQIWPTTYYGPDSGVGLAFKALVPGPRRVGIVGLGIGTLASYARAGDHFHFYEIDPQVINLARSRFTYLARSRGQCEVTLGDARLSLESQVPQRFDLLALDAFSSDSIPIHLLTKEAFELYLQHLNPSGVMAVHISNHYLDLEPVVLGLARHFHLEAAVIDHDANPEKWWIYSSTWILLCRDREILKQPSICSAAAANTTKKKREVALWSDDFSSVLQILR